MSGHTEEFTMLHKIRLAILTLSSFCLAGCFGGCGESELEYCESNLSHYESKFRSCESELYDCKSELGSCESDADYCESDLRICKSDADYCEQKLMWCD